MPKRQDRSNPDLTRYDAMTDEALEEILRLDAEKDSEEAENMEQLLYVMELLAQRRKNTDIYRKSPEEAFASFKEHYLPDTDEAPEEAAPVITYSPAKKAPRTRIKALPAAAAALALCSALTIAASASGMLDTLIHWGQEIFCLHPIDPSYVTIPQLEGPYNTDSLTEYLSSLGYPEIIVPTWIPDGFVCTEYKADTAAPHHNAVFLFENGDRSLVFRFSVYIPDAPSALEKSGDSCQLYERNGVTYVLYENNAQKAAAWRTNGCECAISGDISKEELIQIIDSIGG